MAPVFWFIWSLNLPVTGIIKASPDSPRSYPTDRVKGKHMDRCCDHDQGRCMVLRIRDRGLICLYTWKASGP